MKSWIISESNSLTAAIQKSLSRLGIDSSLSRTIDARLYSELAAALQAHGQIVFFAMVEPSDDQFQALRTIRSLTDKELVVVGPPPGQDTLLDAMRAGATDYLIADDTLDLEIDKLISRLKSAQVQGIAKGRLISLVPCNAPCDGSVLAVNMAAAIAQQTGKCALLDLHLRGGDLALLLKINPRHTVYDLLTLKEDIDEAVFQQALTEHPSGIRLLAGPPMFSDLRFIEPGTCQRLLSLAQYSHPFVTINCEDIVHAEQIHSLLASDDVVLVMRMDLVSLHRAKNCVDFMTRHGVARNRIHVVAMGTGLQGELPTKTVTNLLGIDVHCIPNDPASVTVSINVGNPLVLEVPRSPASKAIVRFTEQLAGLKQKQAATKPYSIFGKAASALNNCVAH